MLGVDVADIGDKGYRFVNSLYTSPNLELWSAENVPSKAPSQLKKTTTQVGYNIKQWGNRLIGNPERFK